MIRILTISTLALLVATGCNDSPKNAQLRSDSASDDALSARESIDTPPTVESTGFVPRIVGIGVALNTQGVYPKVKFIVPDGAASRSGQIELNDEIVAIESQSQRYDAREMTMEEVTAAIRGVAGTQLALDLFRDGEPFTVKLTRDVVPIKEFAFSKSLVGKNVGGIRFTTFDDNAQGSMSNFRGKILVIDVWATFCAPCQKPMTMMQEYFERNPSWHDKVVLVGASIDENHENAVEHAKRKSWSNTVNVHLEPAAIEALDVQAVPLLVIANPDGMITYYGDVHAVSVPDIVNQMLKDR